MDKEINFKYDKNGELETMKNDLTGFEKNLLRSINMLNGTKFNYKNLMEWSSNKDTVSSNLKDGEEIYEVMGVFVAIKKN